MKVIPEDYFEEAKFVASLVKYDYNQGENPNYHVAYNVNDPFFLMLGASLVSILQNNPNVNFTFHIFTDGYSEENRQRLEMLAKQNHCCCYLYKLNMEPFADFHIKVARFSRIAYARIYMPKVLKKFTQRYLYVDADAMCVAPIKELMERDLQGAAIGAVSEFPESVRISHNVNIKMKRMEPMGINKKCLTFGHSGIIANAESVHIGYGTDDNFVMPMGVSIISVLENNPDLDFVFHVLTEGISEKSILQLRKIADAYPRCAFQIHTIDLSVINGLPVYALGKATYIRVFLDQILPDSVDRILYLDGDIVCIGSLMNLWNTDFDGKTVMVVEDVPKTAIKQGKKFNIKHYFNAGMIFMNMKCWKQKTISDKFLKVCFTYKEKLNYLDQDALNIVLQDQKLLMGKQYNYIPESAEVLEIPQDTVFLHYAGTKPWYCWLEFPLKEYFMKYYAMSPWKDESLAEPRNYREMHYMSRACWRRGEYSISIKWFIKYVIERKRTKK